MARFSDLPFELREAIWHFAIPAPRIFHVRGIIRIPTGDLPKSRYHVKFLSDCEIWKLRCFDFHRPPPLPSVTRICRESRVVALNAGYILLPTAVNAQDGDRYTWFNALTDVLYLESPIESYSLGGFIPFPGLSLIRNVGLDWRSCLKGVRIPAAERASDEDDVGYQWENSVRELRCYFTALETVSFVMPAVRQASTDSALGGEPVGFEQLESELDSISLETTIPAQNGDRTWGELQGRLRSSLERNLSFWEDEFGQSCNQPEVVGYMLLRDRSTL